MNMYVISSRQDLERSITKATCYGGLISSMLTLNDKLSDPEQTLSQIDITTFLSDIVSLIFVKFVCS